jgi:hypothetical protein
MLFKFEKRFFKYNLYCFLFFFMFVVLVSDENELKKPSERFFLIVFFLIMSIADGNELKSPLFCISLDVSETTYYSFFSSTSPAVIPTGRSKGLLRFCFFL